MKATDITMCVNHDCILNKKCHRHEAEPEEYYQSYASFSGGKDCEYFWDMGKGTPDETPNTNPETPKERIYEEITGKLYREGEISELVSSDKLAQYLSELERRIESMEILEEEKQRIHNEFPDTDKGIKGYKSALQDMAEEKDREKLKQEIISALEKERTAKYGLIERERDKFIDKLLETIKNL